MNQLRTYLKDLSDDQRRDLAERCGTTFGHLRNIGYDTTGRKCSPELAALVDLQTGGQIRRWHLRPFDWHLIWPELVGAVGAPRVQVPTKTARVGQQRRERALSQFDIDRIVNGSASAIPARRDGPNNKREGR